MGFQKGNQLARANKDSDNNKRGQWNNIVGWLVGEGGVAYQKLIAKQAMGDEILKPQREFMDRYETLLEFHAPKLARQTNTVDIKGNFEFVIKKPDETN